MTSLGLDPPLDEDGLTPSDALNNQHQPTDLQPFRTYLLRLLPPVLSATSASLDTFLAEGAAWETTATKFLSDSNVNAVYVSQLRAPGAEDDERYELSTSLAYSEDHKATLALIKRSPTIDLLTPLSSQLHLLNLFGPSSSSLTATAPPPTDGPLDQAQAQAQPQPQAQAGETPYESLHQIVHWGVGPWFEAFVESRASSKGGAGGEGKDVSKGEDGKMGTFLETSSLQ